jgi:glycine/D-amino acid oxidase-like deaminating enzyme
MDDSGFSGSLWSRISTPMAASPHLEGTARCDVAVIGGGYLGLATAVHLAQAGAAVRLLEAEEPGFGASGRNSGFVVPSFTTALGPESVKRALGPEFATRLATMIAGAGDFVFDLIRRHAISCDAEQRGWLQPAHSPARVDFLRRRRDEWAAVGKSLDLLDRAQTQRLIGTPHYEGALLDRSGGQLNPLAYARGLASAAQSAGAVLYARSPALSVERHGSAWRTATPHGELLADQVVLATNALTGPLAPTFARSLFPVHAYQIATEPLGSADLRTILPERQCVTDTRRHSMAIRLTADNRLVSGGLTVFNTRGAAQRAAPYFLKRLHDFFPGRGPFHLAFAWRGQIAVTPDFLPRVMQLGPGLFGAVGCSGRGITMSTALGERLAAFLVRQDPSALPVPITTARPIPFHALMRHGPSFWLPLSRWRDRRESTSKIA